MIEHYDMNVAGTDYICADVHGHFDLLKEKLVSVKFNKKTDRLFSLGDLIDRGKDSDRVLEWLEQPWFHAIQGNHENALIRSFEGSSEVRKKAWNQWMSYGGDWALDLNQNELDVYYAVISKLPVAIELTLTDHKKIGLVHASLPNECDWTEVVAYLQQISPDKARKSLKIHNMLWYSEQLRMIRDELRFVKPVANIDHVFHGHKIIDNYYTITNRTFMDLGSYHTGAIGFISPIDILSNHDDKRFCPQL